MNPTTLPTADAAQIIQALPPQWHNTADLVLKVGALLLFAGHFLASHGGAAGIWKAVWNGKPGA